MTVVVNIWRVLLLTSYWNLSNQRIRWFIISLMTWLLLAAREKRILFLDFVSPCCAFISSLQLLWFGYFLPFFFPDGPPICQRFDHSDTLRPFPSSLITVQTRFLSFLIFFFCSGRHVPATPARISFSTRPTRPIIISFPFRIPFWQQTIRTSCSATAALQRFLLGNRKWENK